MIIAALNVSDSAKTPSIACVKDENFSGDTVELATADGIAELKAELAEIKEHLAKLKG